jgi:hypothetical protein
MTLEQIYDDLLQAEADAELQGDFWRFWQLVRIFPEPWVPSFYGHDVATLWVVAVCGKRVVWHNDVEGGYAVTRYQRYGELTVYSSGQRSVKQAVQELWDLVKQGSEDL